MAPGAPGVKAPAGKGPALGPKGAPHGKGAKPGQASQVSQSPDYISWLNSDSMSDSLTAATVLAKPASPSKNDPYKDVYSPSGAAPAGPVVANAPSAPANSDPAGKKITVPASIVGKDLPYFATTTGPNGEKNLVTRLNGSNGAPEVQMANGMWVNINANTKAGDLYDSPLKTYSKDLEDHMDEFKPGGKVEVELRESKKKLESQIGALDPTVPGASAVKAEFQQKLGHIPLITSRVSSTPAL